MPVLTATDRYIARRVFTPLVATLTLAAMLLLLEKMLKLFNIVINSGGPVGIVWKMIANLLPEYFSLGIPIGLLLGTLIAFRGLALSSELDALRSVGLSYTRLLRVPYLYAVALMALNVAIVGFLQPIARYSYEQLRFDLRSGALGASIKVGEFTNLGKRMTLRVERSERQGRLLHGVFVRAETRDGKTIAATADHGTFLSTDDPNTILLRLSNGRLVHNAPAYRAPRVLSFEIQDLPVNLPAIEEFRRRGGSLKGEELTLPELLKLGEARHVDRQTQTAARANFHYRLVEIVMMLLMPLLAVALAVPPKRSTSGLGIFLSIVMVVTYHKVNQYAERMGELGRMDPVIAMWTPFVLFSALIVWMYVTLAYRPGASPGTWRASSFCGASRWWARSSSSFRRSTCWANPARSSPSLATGTRSSGATSRCGRHSSSPSSCPSGCCSGL
jgi:lipopolysaccharide export system permease protein